MKDIERIERLQALKDSGALTETEFEEQKRRALRGNDKVLWVAGAATVAVLVVATAATSIGLAGADSPPPPVAKVAPAELPKAPTGATTPPVEAEQADPLLELSGSELARKWVGNYPSNAYDASPDNFRAPRKGQHDFWGYPQTQAALSQLLTPTQLRQFNGWDKTEGPISISGVSWARISACKAHSCTNSMTLYVNLSDGRVRGCWNVESDESWTGEGYWIVPRRSQTPLGVDCSVSDEQGGDYRP